jgi:hypothetical protein
MKANDHAITAADFARLCGPEPERGCSCRTRGNDHADWCECYAGGSMPSIHETQKFGVWRADGKPMIKVEREALYWYFRGVLAVIGIVGD